jgi:hypothetical protein
MEDIESSGAVVTVKAGDRVLFCFRDDISAMQAESMRYTLQDKMPGVDFGLVGGVTGVIVQRAEGNPE